ncbi:MAG: hypothetical protein HYU41_25950 [Candidatus Rokubacteria bacterium]|nr:hypothetical protein [Candidatus Rokubacteria bacterium]
MNPWKMATLGIVTVLTTSLGASLTTAWLMRPTTAAQAETVGPMRYAVDAGPTRPRVVTTRAAAASPASVSPSASVRPVAYGSAPADCGTTGDRVWRIAKPGLIGTVLGAGAGAAGGAIADGGKAAGKGALIGGLAGAALGSAYGAYKTKNECGTILGGAALEGNGATVPASDRSIAYAPSTRAAAASSGSGITVYDAGRSLPR